MSDVSATPNGSTNVSPGEPLLATKLYVPPVRPNLVARPRLLARLAQGLSSRLILVSAPAGFGKTTLLSEWISDLGLRTANCGTSTDPKSAFRIPKSAWLSLDAGDNDPLRFLTYLIAALQTVVPGLGEPLKGLLQSPQAPPVEWVLTALVNELCSLPGDVVLVFDDYHLIESSAVHEGTAFLLDHLPPQMHLGIATRADPPLPLARWRSRGHMLELRADDLRFTADEAAAFLNHAMGLNLCPEDVTALETRTEGWIVGLHMAALSLQGLTDVSQFIQTFSGSHRYVLDYLVEEVLNHQPEGIQTFLLRTSILDRLCDPLCDEVIGIRDQGSGSRKQEASLITDHRSPITAPRSPITDSQSILEYLERSNLFLVPLDDERRWYRYHHLFADLLRNRLRQAQPGSVPELHRRASAWYEAQNQIPAALDHALAGQHFELAARIIEQVGSRLLATGGWGMLLVWLQALPAALVRARPALALLYAWALVLTGQPDGVERHLSGAERAMSESGMGEDRADRNWQGQAAAIRGRAAYLQGDWYQAIEHSRQAYDLVPEEDLTTRGILTITLGMSAIVIGDLAEASRLLEHARRVNEAAGNLVLAVDAAGSLAQVQEAQGHLHQAAGTYREILRLAGDGLDPNVIYAHLNLGNVLYEWYDLEGAQHHFQAGLSIAQKVHIPDGILFAMLWLARVRLAQGDTEGSSDLLRQAEGQAQSFSKSVLGQLAAAWMAQLALARGEEETAAHWAAETTLPPDDALSANFFLRKVEYLALVRLLIAQARFAEAEQLLDKLLTVAVSAGLTGCELESLALKALARQGRGDTAGAITALAQALERAEPEGYMGTFVDLGTPMAQLVQAVGRRPSTVSRAYLTRLLAAFAAGTPDKPGAGEGQTRWTSTGRAHPSLIESLTPRELDVLHLIAAGASNQQIATQLVVSVGTVKKHLNNIFGKLGANSRTQVVALARELGLLP